METGEIVIPFEGPAFTKEEISNILKTALTSIQKDKNEILESLSDELEPPSHIGSQSESWVLRCRIVKNASMLDQFIATPSRRRSSTSGRSAAAINSPLSQGRETKHEAADDEADDVLMTVNNLREENQILRGRLLDVEENWKKALQNIKSYHQSQDQLFNDFVVLREKYDTLKTHIAEVLWSYLPARSDFCPSIPAMRKNLFESEKRVGQYAIAEKLGEGQFAKVFTVRACRRSSEVAEDMEISSSSNQKEYALKVINKDKITSLMALKRVDNEIGAQHRLHHRGILRIHEVMNGEYGLYLIMDKGGKDLFDYFDEQGTEFLEEERSRRLVRCILDAINFCHSQGVCHRDLKPENILLSTTSTNDIADVKLCDFGLCCFFSADHPELTDFCGSPGFFAPEMITAASYRGPAVDYWSVGCILLELTVGHEAFCEHWMVAYDYALLQEPAKFERRLRECLISLHELMTNKMQLNPHLIDFIFGLLTVDPMQRFDISKILSHPWIALDNGQSFLTGSLETLSEERRDDSDDNDDDIEIVDIHRQALVTSPSSAKKNRPTPLAVKTKICHEIATEEKDLPPPTLPSLSKSSSSSWTSSIISNGSKTPPLRTSMSHKARSKIEQQLLQNRLKAAHSQDSSSQQSLDIPTTTITTTTLTTQTQVLLPPAEPATPAITQAKKMLWTGDELLLRKAQEVSLEENKEEKEGQQTTRQQLQQQEEEGGAEAW